MSTCFLVESGDIARPGTAIPGADIAADLARRGHDVTDGIEFVDRSDVGELFDRYDAVWRW